MFLNAIEASKWPLNLMLEFFGGGYSTVLLNNGNHLTLDHKTSYRLNGYVCSNT